MRHYVLTTSILIAGQERQVSITFTYVRGTPEQGPSYASGGEPATGPEIEIVRATIETDGRRVKDGWEPCPQWFIDILQSAIRSGDLSEDDFADVVNGQEK